MKYPCFFAFMSYSDLNQRHLRSVTSQHLVQFALLEARIGLRRFHPEAVAN